MLFKSDKGLMSYARNTNLLVKICLVVSVTTLVIVLSRSCEESTKIEQIQQILERANG
jgi:hypothetical protein